MKSKSISYFEWNDIQEAICKEMNIKKNEFRDYHDVIGGYYKDLWHEWLYFFCNDQVSNDVIIFKDINRDDINHHLGWVKEENKEWLTPFIYAVYNVWENNGIKYVRFSW